MGKYYDNPKEIIKSQQHNLSALALSLGKKDIGFFCEYFLTTFFVPNSDCPLIRPLVKVHYEIFEELNKMFANDEYDYEEFILSRGLGKSTVINKALGCWSHCYKYSYYTMVIGKTEEDAVGFIDSTKQMLLSEKIKDNFGVLIEKSPNFVVNKQELELTNGTKIQAISSGTSVRGKTFSANGVVYRPSIIITDDYINESDILTDSAREKVLNKYYKEILESGDKANYRNGKKISKSTKFLVIGTPLSSKCMISTIKNDPMFRVFQRGVLNFDPDKYFNENKYWLHYKEILLNPKDEDRVKHAEEYYLLNASEMTFERLWNEKWSCCYIANMYFTKRLAFMQELMCDCEKVGDVWITNMAKLSNYEIQSKKYETTVLSIDPAATSNTNSDSTAFTVLSKLKGFYYVREGNLCKFDGKTEFDRYIAFVIELVRKYPDITHIILEKNVYKGVDAARIEESLNSDPQLKRRRIEVILIYNTKNKDERLSTITDKINSGQIIFNESDKEYNDEIFNFRGQKYSSHDDSLDSLEMAINKIDSVKKTNKITFLDRRLLF